MNGTDLNSELARLRKFFDSGTTRSYQFRKEQLLKLKRAIEKYEQPIYDALLHDLKRSREETWVTENGLVLAELRNAIRNLKQWMQPERVKTNLVNLPSSSRVIREPLGVILIIGPWNYPFQLCMNPLVGAIAAGNCAVIKPSEFAPATGEVMKSIIEETFPREYILYVQGDGATVIPNMMNAFRFDHVFYTGSTRVGKQVYKMAAEQLVPVTLELGGKSPAVVESDADIKVAARRIAVTKFSNAGQMCVAPDYVLVHESRKQQFIDALKNSIIQFYGINPEVSDSYGKMINQRQFERVSDYLKYGEIAHGGRTNTETLFIEPTIVVNPVIESPLMKEEIFGPILPVISYKEKTEALQVINSNPEPLSFYVFTSSNKKEKEWLEAVSFGGGCVNNASWHYTNHHLPFGGRGNSGTGGYHGKYSFETFSHRKAIMKTPSWFDPSVKYPPFKGKLKLFKWVIR